MNKKEKIYNLYSVRKKTMILSKFAGGMLVLFYLVTEDLPMSRNASFWIWFTLLIAVIIGVDCLLGRLISKPLHKINDTAKQMAELDFSAHCDIQTKDEFGELSKSLNTMSSNLQEALDKLEAANSQLEKDVAHERILLHERRELVDRLSHEMKTPLGLIRAYTEGLDGEIDSKKRQQYMNAILDATERMDDLIISLLDLSALESGVAKLAKERFDFIELVETVAGRLLLDTPETNYVFHYELPEDKVFILADRKRIEQVVNNLIGNAKKYADTNGEIRLSVICGQERLCFSIFNQCKPIPVDELTKLWEKFYRRQNQSSKGSGLGLAIVAQVLSIYNVPYGARCVEHGVEFFFEFPIVK